MIIIHVAFLPNVERRFTVLSTQNSYCLLSVRSSANLMVIPCQTGVAVRGRQMTHDTWHNSLICEQFESELREFSRPHRLLTPLIINLFFCGGVGFLSFTALCKYNLYIYMYFLHALLRKTSQKSIVLRLFQT